MIISKTPLRLTLAGGGTDQPEYYEKYHARILSAAINKYIYVVYKPNYFDGNCKLRYSKTEIVNDTNELEHDRAKAVLQHYVINNSYEIGSFADLPSNSGLGSSGSFTVGLVNVVAQYKRLRNDARHIAGLSYDLERRLGHPVGMQDPYIAAYGGIKLFDVDRGGVEVHDYYEKVGGVIPYLMLFYTGRRRDASPVLRRQLDKAAMMPLIAKDVDESIQALEDGDYAKYGKLMGEYWEKKKLLSSCVSWEEIDRLFDDLNFKFGIEGHKVIGAGGGGFIMLFVHEKKREVKAYMEEKGFKHLDYGLDMFGSQIVANV